MILEFGVQAVAVLALGEPFHAPWPVFNWDTFDDRRAMSQPNLRRAVVGRRDGSGSAIYYVLWWGEPGVAEDFDARLAEGRLALADLSSACLATFGSITCLRCAAQFRALIAEQVEPLAARGVTSPPPPEAWRRACPVCHEVVSGVPLLELVEPRGWLRRR